jgi:hypothetical protein
MVLGFLVVAGTYIINFGFFSFLKYAFNAINFLYALLLLHSINFNKLYFHFHSNLAQNFCFSCSLTCILFRSMLL